MSEHACLSHDTYESVAKEYYDSTLHPTCAALRELSLSLIGRNLTGLPSGGLYLEVGVGDSILAPIADQQGLLRSTILLDSSKTMLEYSIGWRDRGAKLVNEDVAQTSLPDSSVSLALSSLGDPYNTHVFWQEMARILKPDGCVVFTTPAYQWSSKFRKGTDPSLAEFIVKGGRSLALPSFVCPFDDQLSLLERVGLRCSGYDEIGIGALGLNVPPKLSFMGLDKAAVSLYRVEKADT